MASHFERGFSLVELLIIIVIIAVLSALGMTSFYVYKSDAEYAKAESTLHGARIAYEAAPVDLVLGFSTAYSLNGGLGIHTIAGPIRQFLPGAMLPPDIQFGSVHNACSGANPLDVQAQFTAIPCRGTNYVSWTRFCGGIEIKQQKIAKEMGCW